MRVGLFGTLGSGNLGNDGSLEAVMDYLRSQDRPIELGFFCMGPREVTARYGAPARSLQWYEEHAGTVTGFRAVALKVLGKLLDPFRTLAWVRHYDVVIVPGMGVLEATVPLRAWAFPYSLFWLGVAARVTGARMALVSVGADLIGARTTRWLVVQAARLAHYRSFRDELSRNAMYRMGVDVTADRVYPDLTFALRNPPPSVGAAGSVGVGIMAYRGNNDERAEAGDLHRHYIDTMIRFLHWLLDRGRKVRLHATDKEDRPILQTVLDDIRAQRSDNPDIEVDLVSSLPELMSRLAAVDTVVASRYHNVLAALKMSRPTLSVGYATKHEELMEDMGMGEFSEAARSVDLDRLAERFQTLEHQREAVVAGLDQRNAEKASLLNEQFAALSLVLNLAVDDPFLPRRPSAKVRR